MKRILILLLAFGTVTTSLLNAAGRENTVLQSGWRFLQADPAGAQTPGLADTNWQAISLPHNWGWDQAHLGRKYLRAPGWYRRDLNIGTPVPGRRYFVRFEAASTVAEVYLNGEWLGEHRGGFGAFCYEITKQLSATGTNLLAVRVDNTAQPDIAPISGDFSIYGGLYRLVHLIETEATCFTPTDHGSPGIAWLQTSVTTTQAVLDVNVEISNGTKSKQPRTLVASVLAADGHLVATTEQAITLMPNLTEPFTVRVTVPNPHLWNGRQDPYLYRAVVTLRGTNDVALDGVTEPLGLRFYRVDPDRGFFLNGQPYALHGVNKHQDRPIKGWAVSDADLDEDMSLIKAIGATVVRCAHYQHSDYFYSLCDRAGILVWAEIPQVNQIESSPEFAETSRNQLLDLIRQNINHPSIFVWSLFNELWPNNPDPHRELQDLNIVAHGEDPTRPTIAATSNQAQPQMNKIPDLLGWNVYPGWYADWGTKEEVGSILDARRDDSRHGGFCVSEYGAGANVTQHEQNPKPPVTTSQWHPEEWQASLHEAAYQQMKARPFIWGTFVWCMFDFAVSTRHEGGLPGLNDKGLVTYDRKTRKDAFYFYQANWTEAPMVYLTDRRFTERTNAVTDVKAYSNARTVELFLNGTSQGARRNDGNAVFLWKNLTLKPGENNAEARAEKDGQTVSDHCDWSLRQ